VQAGLVAASSAGAASALGGFGGPTGKYLQTNRVRVDLFEDYSNSAFNARPYALNAPDASQIAYYQERAGVSIGGPLSIRRIYNGKDKTSFFVHYQLQRGRSPFSTYSTVPTLAERSGDFSQAVSSSQPLAGTCRLSTTPCRIRAGRAQHSQAT
jgi:hypothetical protein